jgi:hypothetical protein
MTVIKPERSETDESGLPDSSPAQFIPEWRAAGKPDDVERAVNAFEGEIREFVRRDINMPRRQFSDPQPAGPVPDNLNTLIRSVSLASVEEIDRVIAELQSVREMLRTEGDRVTRDIASYADLSQTAMTAMKVISESLAQWKNVPEPSSS